MKLFNTAQEKFKQLRRKAEELIRTKKAIPIPITPEDPLKLIHELQTFQIELELQNEELNRINRDLMEMQIRYTELYDLAPVGYIDVSLKGMILNTNLTFADMLSNQRSLLLNQPLSSYVFPEDQDKYYMHLRYLSNSKARKICELRMKKKDETPLYVQLESMLFLDVHNDTEQYRIIISDISERKQVEKALALERKRLQESLLKVKELRGLLPICSSCKKVRDDKGYWNKLESYIEKHSETKFSHGICPDCSEKFYGKEDWYIEMKKDRSKE